MHALVDGIKAQLSVEQVKVKELQQQNDSLQAQLQAEVS